MTHEPDNRLLVEYLFGELSQPEQDRLEEMYFMNDDVYDQLSAVENDLIDRYVQHTLTEAERIHFEKKYLVTALRRKKVNKSEKLINLIINYQPPSPKPSWWQSFLAFLNHRNMLVQSALAAALLVVTLGCLSLIRDRMRLGRQVEQTQVALQEKALELQRQGEEYRKASEELQEALRSAQAQREDSAPPLTKIQEKTQQAQAETRPAQENRTAQRPVTVATYIFPLVTVRGEQAEKPLVIRQGERSTRLVIFLKKNIYKQYRVSVQRVSREEVWSRSVPKGRSTSAGERLSFELPASVFMKKDYVLIVDAVKTDGTIENLDARSFSVVNMNIQRP